MILRWAVQCRTATGWRGAGRSGQMHAANPQALVDRLGVTPGVGERLVVRDGAVEALIVEGGS